LSSEKHALELLVGENNKPPPAFATGIFGSPQGNIATTAREKFMGKGGRNQKKLNARGNAFQKDVNASPGRCEGQGGRIRNGGGGE